MERRDKREERREENTANSKAEVELKGFKDANSDETI